MDAAAVSAPPPLDETASRASGRSFRRAMAAAAHGRRTPYDRPLHRRVIAVRSVVGVVVVLLLVLLGPLRRPVTSFVGDQVARVVPGMHRTIAVAHATVDDQEQTMSGFLASYAVDGIVSRAWAVSFADSDAGIGEVCGDGEAGAQASLTVRFEEPSAVDRITVRAGLDPTSTQHVALARPRNVDFIFLEDPDQSVVVGCSRALLDDQFEAQHVPVDVERADAVRIRILDAYPPPDGDGTAVAISEMGFATR